MPRTCPRCSQDRPLKAITAAGSLTTDFCEGCGGIFFDPAELGAFLGRGELQELAEDARVLGPGPACPGCGAGMSEVVWPPDSDLHMDLCPKGGVWLDRGEVQRLRTLFAEEVGAGGWASVEDAGGASLMVPLRLSDELSEKLSERSDRAWILWSALIVFVSQVVALGSLRVLEGLAVLSDREVWADPTQLAVASVAGLFLGGVVAGRFSPGFTVWEPAAAAVPALAVFALVFHAPFTTPALAGLLVAGVMLTLAGAALGEALQD